MKKADNSMIIWFKESVSGSFCKAVKARFIEFVDDEISGSILAAYSTHADAESDPIDMFPLLKCR